MNAIRPSNSATLEEQKLPRRDWILLPAICLGTILLIIASAELIVPLIYPHSPSRGEPCMVTNSQPNSYGGLPNCEIWVKLPESPSVEYRFNSSGYRSDSQFTPKAPGTFRIVVMGSSTVMGASVPIEDTFPSRLAPQLSQLTGKKIEIFNMALAGESGNPSVIALRFKDALAAQPDMILNILAARDIQLQSLPVAMLDANAAPAAKTSLISDILQKLQHDNVRFVIKLQHSHIGFLLQHFLYQSQTLYVNSFLIKSNTLTDSNFLRAELNSDWKRQLRAFDQNDADIEARVKAAGVLMVSVLLPVRAQAAMISIGEWPSGYNPYKLDNELRSIITSHGGNYIDILPYYSNIPNPEQGYYSVEGHPNVLGHATIARLLANALTNGAVPALNATASQLRPQEQE